MNSKLRGRLKQQSYVPLEKVTTHVVNKYEAVVVAAAEARKINSVLRMVGRDEAQEKVTSRALRRICTGDIDYVYLDESERLAEAEAFAQEAAAVAVVEAAMQVPKATEKVGAADAAITPEPEDAEDEEDDETSVDD
jgi:DNA-directed RNA polymerase omega subunit